MASEKRIQLDEDRLLKIKRSQNELESINKASLCEMKSYAKPPEALKDILSAVLILLGSEESVSTFKYIYFCRLIEVNILLSK